MCNYEFRFHILSVQSYREVLQRSVASKLSAEMRLWESSKLLTHLTADYIRVSCLFVCVCMYVCGACAAVGEEEVSVTVAKPWFLC